MVLHGPVQLQDLNVFIEAGVMRKGLRMVVVVGLAGQLCVPVHAHGQPNKGRSRLLDILIYEAVAALVVEGARVLSETLGDVVFGYCGARWEGEWLRLCERHNESVSDLRRERRLALDDIEFRFANEVPDVVRARCESGTPGDGIDRDCLREEVDREKEQENAQPCVSRSQSSGKPRGRVSCATATSSRAGIRTMCRKSSRGAAGDSESVLMISSRRRHLTWSDTQQRGGERPGRFPCREDGRPPRRAIVAATAATLIGTTLAPSAQGQQQEEVRNAVEPDSGLGFMAVLPGGYSVQVYPCARNRATDAIKEHCYLYLPPLTLERNSDGRVLASETFSGGVRVRVRGVSQHLTNGVHAWLAAEEMLPDANRPGSVSVGPLPYHQIRIADADYALDVRWAAVYPGANVTPVPQEWIPIVFTPRDGVSESPAEFIERLNDPGRLPSLIAVLGYSGRTVEIVTQTLKASDLKQTNFLLDLKGDGGRDFVTRDQRHELTSRAATYVTQRHYKEGPDDVDVKLDVKLDGLLVLFKEIRMSWQELWSSSENLLRVGFSGMDLLPDTHTQMQAQIARELLDEEDPYFSEAVSHYLNRGPWSTSVGSKGSVPGIASAEWDVTYTSPSRGEGEARRVEKAEYKRHLEKEDSFFHWDGQVIVPKDIVLYQLDEAQLDTDTELASIEVKTTRSTASLGYTIYNAPVSLRIPFCYPTCAGADLGGADLGGADLTDADLTDADLTDADLTDADLTGADLRGANLTDADLRGANLTDADLRGANLTRSNLSRRDVGLRDTVLTRAKLHGATLHGANLAGTDLRTATLSGTDSTRADLRGADLRGVDLGGADLGGADLDRRGPDRRGPDRREAGQRDPGRDEPGWRGPGWAQT